MCQRVNTGKSYIFYFGIFICDGPLSSYKGNAVMITYPHSRGIPFVFDLPSQFSFFLDLFSHFVE